MVAHVVTHKKLWEVNSAWDVLTATEKMIIDSEVEYRQYKRNEIIYSEGDEPTHMMMLVSGKVRIFKEGVGQKHIIRMLKPGDIFSYRPIIAGDSNNSSASAMEDTEVLAVNKHAFLSVLQQNNQFCFQVMTLMARDLAISELRTVNLTQKHIRGRLAETLLTLKKNYGLDDDGVTVAMYLSREDLANMSNMTTANAIRTLSQFAQEGIIAVDGRRIKILNEANLIKISQIG